MMRSPLPIATDTANPTVDLVAVGEDWGGHPSSTHHLMWRLAQRRRVLWINSLGLRRPQFTARDVARAARKLRAALMPSSPGSTTAAVAAPAKPDSMSVLSPLAVSWPSSSLAAALNGWLLPRQVLENMRHAGIERPVLWTSMPSALPLVGAIGERAVVYYCGDDFGALAGVDHEPVLEMEHRLANRADLIIAASESLFAKFPSAKTLLLPHGADIDLFSSPVPRAADLPRRGKTAGFYGSISEWIDVDLVAKAAQQLHDWTFVFVGPVQTDIGALEALPNVITTGPRPHAALPGYVQHWDVSLVPFRDTPQIKACNPLKLREYLAAGTPIASVDFPAASHYRSLLSIVDHRLGLADAILSADRDRGRNQQRKDAVRSESWDARAAVVSARIDDICRVAG